LNLKQDLKISCFDKRKISIEAFLVFYDLIKNSELGNWCRNRRIRERDRLDWSLWVSFL